MRILRRSNRSIPVSTGEYAHLLMIATINLPGLVDSILHQISELERLVQTYGSSKHVKAFAERCLNDMLHNLDVWEKRGFKPLQTTTPEDYRLSPFHNVVVRLLFEIRLLYARTFLVAYSEAMGQSATKASSSVAEAAKNIAALSAQTSDQLELLERKYPNVWAQLDLSDWLWRVMEEATANAVVLEQEAQRHLAVELTNLTAPPGFRG